LSISQWKKYLAILKLDSSSTSREIKDSFLKLSKVYHPDNKLTGSHAKFVELKEAYDALKDGQQPSSASSSSRYDEDLSHKAHRRHRDIYQNYTDHTGYGSGAGFGQSGKTEAWEAYARERAYQRQRADWNSFGQRRPFSSGANFTIFLGAIAWIFIYSGILLVWDYNDAIKKGTVRYNARTKEDYLAYEEFLRRKEQRRLLRSKELPEDSIYAQGLTKHTTTRESSPSDPVKEGPNTLSSDTIGSSESTNLIPDQGDHIHPHKH